MEARLARVTCFGSTEALLCKAESSANQQPLVQQSCRTQCPASTATLAAHTRLAQPGRAALLHSALHRLPAQPPMPAQPCRTRLNHSQRCSGLLSRLQLPRVFKRLAPGPAATCTSCGAVTLGGTDSGNNKQSGTQRLRQHASARAGLGAMLHRAPTRLGTLESMLAQGRTCNL